MDNLKVRGRGRARPIESTENPSRWKNVIQDAVEPSINIPQIPQAPVKSAIASLQIVSEPVKVVASPPIVAELPVTNEIANNILTPAVVDENNNLPNKKSVYKFKKQWIKPAEEEDDLCAVCDRSDGKVFCKTCSHSWKVKIL